MTETQGASQPQISQPSFGLSASWMAVALVGLLVVGLLGYALVSEPSASLEIGDAVPNFQLVALDGSSIDLGAERGKVVVINIFASWCAPCREEAADLEQTWRAYKGRGVQFFGIAYKDAPSRAQMFLDEFNVSYPSGVDPGNRIARSFGVTGVPETFVVDQDGLLVAHFVGAVTQPQLVQAIEGALRP